jgi:hypothetical protein
MGAYAPPRNPTMQRRWLPHSIAAVYFIIRMPLFPPTQAITAIATCSSNKQQQPQKAPPAKTPTHRGGNRRSDCHLDKFPKTVNVNAILANINLPQTRFETILTALGPATEGCKETEENPAPPGHYAPTDNGAGNSALPPNLISPLPSPNQEPTFNVAVRINKTPDSVPPPMNNSAPRSTPNAPRSILRSAPPADTTEQTATEATDFKRDNNPARKTILDKNCRLLITLGVDGNKKSFHVEDFASLYPVWPIVEVAISPTRNAKEERMNIFVKCITSLFGKILYVNNTAGIAPLEIIDNNKDNFIYDKSKLPSNFTRLGK